MVIVWIMIALFATLAIGVRRLLLASPCLPGKVPAGRATG